MLDVCQSALQQVLLDNVSAHPKFYFLGERWHEREREKKQQLRKIMFEKTRWTTSLPLWS